MFGRFLPNIVWNSVIHGFSHGQPIGRWSVSFRADDAIRAGTKTTVRRMVPVLALASAGSPVSVAAAPVRLNAVTAQTSHAVCAQECAEGMCASAEFFRSACTCSMIACRRWILSAATVPRSARFGGGEEGVESPYVEQLALSLILLRSQVRNTADDQTPETWWVFLC